MVDAARARLRAAGLRGTAPRIAVLGELERAATPLTHAEIASTLVPRGLDRVTVYRNLLDLADAGLVRRTDLGDHVWRFELRRSGAAVGGAHPHFVCTDCGGVACLPGVDVRLRARRDAPRAVRRRDVEVQLQGRCDRCA